MTSYARTVNRGMMDQWVKAENLVPMQERHGIKVNGMWVNEDRNQFIWIRSFNDAADLAAKEAAFYESDEWKAAVDHTRSHLASAHGAGPRDHGLTGTNWPSFASTR